jgi:hypothetical protein
MKIREKIHNSNKRLTPFFLSKKFAKIGLSAIIGGGFNPVFCFTPQIFIWYNGRKGKASQTQDNAQRTWVYKLH